MPLSVAPAIPADTYRRQARRLRCRFADQPLRLQLSLKALADRAAPAAGQTEGVKPMTSRQVLYPASAQSGNARSFTDHLAESMTSSVLCYSQRLAFIRDARGFGLTRFEANLLIAAMLQQRGMQRAAPPAEEFSVHRGSLLSGLTVFLAVQGAVLLGTWWTMFR